MLGFFSCCRSREARAHVSPPGNGVLARARCPQCALEVGTGTTFFGPHWTDGITTPIFLEIDQSRWELGAYRFHPNRLLKESAFPAPRSAHPFSGHSPPCTDDRSCSGNGGSCMSGSGLPTRPGPILTQGNFAYLLALYTRTALISRVFRWALVECVDQAAEPRTESVADEHRLSLTRTAG